MFPRSAQKEWMDDFSIQDERIDGALKELAVINTWLGGHAASRAGVRSLLRRIPEGDGVSILDVGAGGSDFAHAVSALRPGIRVTALDRNERACAYASRMFPEVRTIRGSVLDLPFENNSFDIVHASLFLHHFTDPELRRIIPRLYAVARYGIVVNDLRRSTAALAGISILTRFFSHSAMVQNDAPLSVRRAFTRDDIDRLCSYVPDRKAVIRRKWAFRWLVYIGKDA